MNWAAVTFLSVVTVCITVANVVNQLWPNGITP